MLSPARTTRLDLDDLTRVASRYGVPPEDALLIAVNLYGIDVDQAAVTAHEALPVARSGGSVRIVDELRAVAHDLAPHRRVGAVADLLDDLEE